MHEYIPTLSDIEERDDMSTVCGASDNRMNVNVIQRISLGAFRRTSTPITSRVPSHDCSPLASPDALASDKFERSLYVPRATIVCHSKNVDISSLHCPLYDGKLAFATLCRNLNEESHTRRRPIGLFRLSRPIVGQEAALLSSQV